MSLHPRPPREWRRWALAVLAAAGLFGCSRGPATLEEVIERNTEATGGRAAIEAVRSIRVDLHIVDPGFSVDGVYQAVRPGKMRIDIMSSGKRVFTEAFDGQRAWEGRDEALVTSPKAAAALRHGLELPGKLFGLHEVQQRGQKLELSGRETIAGIDYYVLRLTFADGDTTTLYVDPHTWLVTRRRDVRPLHVDVDPTPVTIESHYSDFRAISGVQFAFANVDVDLATGKVLETTTVKSILVNPAVAEAIFEKL